MTPANSDSGDSSSATSMEQVHAAWLAAGAQGDVETMRRLRRLHPQWLDLQRLVNTPASGAPTRRQFCSWESFHLSTSGASTLLTAAWGHSLDVVEMLLEAGQDPDTRNHGGRTPSMVALLRYNVVVMRCGFRNNQAVRRNIVEDCRHEDSDLARDNVAVTKVLLRFGADASARSQHGLVRTGIVHSTTLRMAMCLTLPSFFWMLALTSTLETSMNMLQIMLNHHHMVATAHRRDFAADVLSSAVDIEIEGAVRLIVEGGYSSVTVSNTAGETPLHHAIVKRSPQLMELLVDLDPAGGSLTAVTAMGESPAHYAAQHGSVSVMETLLRQLAVVFGDLQELDEATNPLNAMNNAGRRVCRMVLRSPRSELLLLHEHVRRDILHWLREAHDQNLEVDHDDDVADDDAEESRISGVLLTELCAEWVASVDVLPVSSPRRVDLADALLVAISAGYAYEFVPLLVELPLLRSAMPRVLDRLERFARVTRAHLLLLQLHGEVSTALSELVET
ncbi:hypothetical protein PHYSODRAFT_344401 [Phytophthora sojae]|uniref:Uncharacterized protein n=1 Tax=Phytophthora sojae (strain P6497) TaxID=1094619 RepID=G4YWN8_PHYSP|nr:hypothetical protein PHYSODRAFT_344401 [Phytophthora sojae]EGZ23219.1 hypothetical protein PHYSODRAFT_344401 [Phytophthora sojae]|eukprot:XP_009518507.1 hypothetical protein PHYSODRAFT_344401 [Phytophthora sojae]